VKNANYQWSPEQDALLGTDSDTAIARRLGVPLGTVRYRRGKLRIPSTSVDRVYDWTPEKDALLGTASDMDVAIKLGITQKQAEYRRRKLRIAYYQGSSTPASGHNHRSPRVDPQKYRHLLGVLKDAEIAKIYKISRATVCFARQQLGIPYASLPSVKNGIPRGVPYEHLLGVIPDAQIAKIYGKSASSVTYARQFRGIEVASRIVAYEHLLGVIPDNEVAKLHGMSVSAVIGARQRRGIEKAPLPKVSMRKSTPAPSGLSTRAR
jgi:hypothetical protein